jgi:hypothetical protein
MPERYQIRPIVSWTDPVTADRQSSGVFRATWENTLALLEDEAERLDVRGPIVMQIDVSQPDIRADGMLRARARVGAFPGVAVSFTSRFGPLRYATDAYEQRWAGSLPGWQANVRAIALALEALRAVDRYGVTKRGEQYQGWTALPAARAQSSRWFTDAGDALAWMKRCAGGEATEDPKALYKLLGRKMHPDMPDGNTDLWERLDAAATILGVRNGDG